MAIKTESGKGLGGEEVQPSPNAMVFEIVRTGQIFFYHDRVAILLSVVSTNTLTTPHTKMRVGDSVGGFRESEEMPQVLAGDGDRYVLETTSETVRVVARFFI